MLGIEISDERVVSGCLRVVTVLPQGISDKLIRVRLDCLAGRKESLWNIQPVKVTQPDARCGD